MKLEIVSAADFLVQLLRLQAGSLSELQLQQFKGSLQDVLRLRYRDHWFPDKPNRGSGYRCIRINGKMDPVIAQAGAKVGLLPTLLHGLFPSELTMWIDPAEVSYRIGENGSICILFEGTIAKTVQRQPQAANDNAERQQRKVPTTTFGNNNISSSPISAHPMTHRLNEQQHQANINTSHLFQQRHGNRVDNNNHFNNSHQQQQQQLNIIRHRPELHHQSQLQHQQTNSTEGTNCFESCKESLMLEYQQFNEQIAAFVSS